MSKLEDLAERVERLVVRHGELRRSTALVEQQLAAMTAERDNLRLRLAAARARVDVLLQRLPTESHAADQPAQSPFAEPQGSSHKEDSA